MHNFSFDIVFQSCGDGRKQKKGEIMAIDASEAILKILNEYPSAKGTVKQIKNFKQMNK